MKLNKPAWPLLLLTHALFLQLATFVVRPAASYRALELGINPGLIGLVASSFAFLPLFVAVFIGRASDSGHNSEILISGSLILVIAGFGLIYAANSIGSLILWNVLLGLGNLMSVIGQQNRVAQGDASKLDSAFGLYTFAGSLGQTLGPTLIIIFGGSSLIPNTKELFSFYFVASIILLIITILLIREKLAENRVAEAKMHKSILSTFRSAEPRTRKTLLSAMLVSLTVIGSVDLIGIYLPVLGLDRKISASTIGALLSIRAIATMFSRFYLGPLVAKFGRNELIIGSVALAGMFTASLVIAMPIWLTGIALLFLGFTLGIGQPLTMTIITLGVPSNTRGTWLAMRLSANRVGQSVLPASIGLCTAIAGVSGVFGATAIALGAVAASSAYLLPRK